MDTGFNGVLLRWQAEGVEPHRVEHIRSPHPVEPGEDVRPYVSEGMPHMEPCARGIGEHVEKVLLWLRVVEIGVARVWDAIQALVSPLLLPALLDLPEIVRRHPTPREPAIVAGSPTPEFLRESHPRG